MFCLGPGLLAVLALRTRCVALVVSDFLDPFDSYAPALRQLMARHRVILVDVAAPLDRAFPTGHWWEINAISTLRREGPWHLEEHTLPRELSREATLAWNAARQSDLRRLRHLARLGGAAFLSIPSGSARDYYLRALLCLKQLM